MSQETGQELGRWQRLGHSDQSPAAFELLRSLAREQRAVGEWFERGARPCYAKGSRFKGKSRWRHFLRAVAGQSLPRLREFDNLLWLRGAGFEAPLPLAALSTWQHGRPIWQGLVTAQLPDSKDAVSALAQSDPGQRRALCRTLGSTLGLLHEAGFLHRDLFLRNLLITPNDTPNDTPNKGNQRIAFLDCWRGGPRTSAALGARAFGRGSAYDLGCLFVHLPGLVTHKDEDLFLETYLEVRKLDGRHAKRFLAQIQTARRFNASREQRRARRDSSPIQEHWLLGQSESSR